MNVFNSAQRQRLVLTPKQVRFLLSSLKSTSSLRGTEKERAYLRKIIKDIEEQTL